MVTEDAEPAEQEIPESMREPFAVLRVEVTRLHYRWKVLKQVYAETRRVELLNTVASGFFGLDQEIWQDAILLGISRVLDANRDATSLRKLVRLASTKVRHDVVPDLEKRLDRLDELVKVVDAYRKARIAHIDAQYHPAAGGSALPPIYVDSLDELVTGIWDLMDAVGNAVGHPMRPYLEPLSDGDTLIYALSKAARFSEIVPPLEWWDELRRGRFGNLWPHKEEAQA